MIADPSETAFRILLVEDALYTARYLAAFMNDTFRHAVIDAPGNVNDAMERIESLRKKNIYYNLAILDFKLPLKQGWHRTIDLGLSRLLNDMQVPVIHITGYPSDPKITEYMQNVYQQDMDRLVACARVMLLAKTTTSKWVEELVRLIRPHHQKVVSDMVRRQMADVFGGDALTPQESTAGAPEHTSTGRSTFGTHALVRLQRNIVENWDVLDAKAKAMVKRVFAVVDLDGDEKRLSLFPVEDGGE